ncbi:MAG TPA: hypothetical protein PKJ33_00385 [Alphaproteobacteria bacterium]|nr:hypothetical protein [Alphaproteobacteria bacterium]
MNCIPNGNNTDPYLDGCDDALSLGCEDSGAGAEIITCLSCSSGYSTVSHSSGCGTYYTCSTSGGGTPCTGTYTTLNVDFSDDGRGSGHYVEHRYSTACDCGAAQ